MQEVRKLDFELDILLEDFHQILDMEVSFIEDTRWAEQQPFVLMVTTCKTVRNIIRKNLEKAVSVFKYALSVEDEDAPQILEMVRVCKKLVDTYEKDCLDYYKAVDYKDRAEKLRKSFEKSKKSEVEIQAIVQQAINEEMAFQQELSVDKMKFKKQIRLMDIESKTDHFTISLFGKVKLPMIFKNAFEEQHPDVVTYLQKRVDEGI